MTEQLALFEHREPVRLTRRDELASEAEAFLEEHPDFWRAFCSFSFELVRAGHSRYGAKAVVERVRWHTAVSGGSDFKVNNNHTATFARIFAATYPEHAHLFAFREQTSGRRAA